MGYSENIYVYDARDFSLNRTLTGPTSTKSIYTYGKYTCIGGYQQYITIYDTSLFSQQSQTAPYLLNNAVINIFEDINLKSSFLTSSQYSDSCDINLISFPSGTTEHVIYNTPSGTTEVIDLEADTLNVKTRTVISNPTISQVASSTVLYNGN